MNEQQRHAFETLKLRLTTEPIFLNFPRWDCPFEVHCDGSKKGIAAVLTQIVDDCERVLMYASKSLTHMSTRALRWSGQLTCSITI